MVRTPFDSQFPPLADRLTAVRDEIARAAARAGRKPEDIRLVAVTKTHPAEVLQAAIQAGMTEIGENYVQEAEDKFAALGWPTAGAAPAPAVRHLIGPLQSNKVRKAVQWFEVIETVDSLALATRIDRIAGELHRTVTCLIQVNISSESTKSGFFPDAVEGVLPRLANLAHIRPVGLMTIGRFSEDPEAARPDFRALRQLRDRLQAICPPGIALTELSMGMSHDFPVAIEEGATIVRVGSRLFGSRS